MAQKSSRRVEPVAKLYARALFEQAQERNQVEEVRADFSQIVQLFQTTPELREVLSAFGLSVDARIAMWTKVCEKSSPHPLVKRLVELLIAKSRLVLLSQMYDAYLALVDESKNILRGTVVTYDALNDSDRAELSKAFSKRFNKQVELEPVIDKTILGGLVVHVQGLTFDGSLRATIQNLKENLERQAV